MAASAATAAAYVGDAVFTWAIELGASEAGALIAADVAQWGAGVAISTGASMAISAGVSSLQDSGKSNTPSSNGNAFGSQANSRTHLARSTIANRQIVYGEAMISGPIVFASSNDNYGTLHLAIALANHECEAIGEVYFNDEPLGTLDANGSPVAGRYYQAVTPGGTLVLNTSDAQLVNRTPATVFQYKYVTLPQAPVTISISDTALTTANNPTSTPYFDGGGAWSNVGYDNVAANMRKNYPTDSGSGYIPWRQFGVNGNIVKMSASASNGSNITITYTTAATGSYYARIRKHLGATDQVADTLLTGLGAGWSNNHRLRGVAYLVTSMVYDKDVYPRGIPNVKAVVKGKKLYDPRTGLTAWSDNPALVLRDYLTASYGLGCPAGEIDDASFIIAANACDALVAIDAGGTTQKRYTCNGVVDMGQRPTDVLRAIIGSCGGLVVWQGGKWLMYAGVAAAPTGATLTADSLRGAIKVSARVPRSSLFNAIKGTFVDPTRGWLPQDYPLQRNSSYVANDGGIEIVSDMPLPMTTNGIMAQRLAKLALDRARQGITITWPGTAKLLDVAVGDVKRITLPHLGWTDKEFSVISWALAEAGAVDLTLQEESAASYDWNYGMATLIDTAPDTSLGLVVPDMPYSVVHVESLTLSGTGVVNSVVDLAWIGATPGYRVEWVEPNGAATRFDTTANFLHIIGAQAGINQFSIYAVDAFGRESLPAIYTPTIYGKTSPPSDVTGLAYAIERGGIRLSWSAVTDIDFDSYEVRVGSTWGAAALVTRTRALDVLWPKPLSGDYLLWVAALDTVGNYSDNPDMVAIAVTGPAVVTGFGISGSMLFWDANGEVDLGGYQVRFNYGVNTDWGAAGKLHDGIIVTSPFTMAPMPTGQVTLMIRAVDLAGNSSSASNWIITDLGDALVANVIESMDFKAAVWPGTYSGATISGGNLVASSDDLFFYKLDASDFYGAAADDFYSVNYDALEWISSGWTPSAAASGSNMTLSHTIVGNSISIQYRPTGPTAFYGVDSDYFYDTDGASAFYDGPLSWQLWPGSVIAQNEEYQFRVNAGIGSTQGVVSAFTASIDVPDKSLKVNSVSILSGGTRLTAAAGVFTVIQNVQLTLQGGSTAVKAEISDYNATLGPLITTKDAAGSGVASTIDAILQGY